MSVSPRPSAVGRPAVASVVLAAGLFAFLPAHLPPHLSAAAAAPGDEWVGRDAHDHVFEHSMQGRPLEDLSLHALAGRTVVLEFWATWCGPCLAAMPHLAELERALEGEPVDFVLVTREEPDLIERFLERRDLPGSVVIDADGSVFDAYGVRAIPRTIVIDREGTVAVITHPSSLGEETLRSIVAGTHEIPATAETADTARTGAPRPDAEAAGADPGEADEPAFRYGAFMPGWDPLLEEHLSSGLIDRSERPWVSVMRPTVDESATGGWGTAWGDGAGLTMLGATARQMIEAAFDLPSPLRVLDEAGLEEDERRWDVIVSRPAPWGIEDVREEVARMVSALCRLELERVTVRRPVLAASLGEVDPELVRSSAEMDWHGDPTARSFRPLEALAHRLEQATGTLVDTAALGDAVVDTWGVTTWRMEPAELRTWLESRGVVFTETEAEVELIRVRRTPEEAAADAG